MHIHYPNNRTNGNMSWIYFFSSLRLLVQSRECNFKVFLLEISFFSPNRPIPPPSNGKNKYRKNDFIVDCPDLIQSLFLLNASPSPFHRSCWYIVGFPILIITEKKYRQKHIHAHVQTHNDSTHRTISYTCGTE